MKDKPQGDVDAGTSMRDEGSAAEETRRATAQTETDSHSSLGPGARRLLQSAGAVAGLVGLAGCSALGGGERSAPDGAGRTPASTQSTPDGGGSTVAATETTTADTGDATATPAASPTSTTCPDTDPIESDIETVEGRIAGVESTIAEREKAETRLLGIRGQLPGGWDDETLETAEAVVESIRESVVVLEYETGGGTGWFIDERHVVTNAHVARDGPATVWTIDGEEFAGTLVGRVESWQPDVALLRVDGTGDPLDLGSSEELAPQTPVVQVGHPLGVGHWFPSLGYYLWREQGMGRSVNYDDMYTSLVGRQGVSGAPVVDLDGDVVALTWGALDREPPREMTQAPEPASDRVVDYPIAAKVWGQHLPVETVVEYYEEWT